MKKYRQESNSSRSKIDHDLNRDEFTITLYNFIEKIVDRVISKEDENIKSLLKLYEKEDIVQMAFIKAFQPTKEGKDFYQRYLERSHKNWYKTLGELVVFHTIQDIIKKKDFYYLTNAFLILMDNEEIVKFGFIPNVSYINEFIGKYGNRKIGESNTSIQDVIEGLIEGYSMTNVCKKFKVTKKSVIKPFNYLNFKDYLIND